MKHCAQVQNIKLTKRVILSTIKSILASSRRSYSDAAGARKIKQCAQRDVICYIN